MDGPSAAPAAPPGRVACIDIGTNSVLLLVAKLGPGGSPLALVERATITRLGARVDQTRKLDAAACQRTLECLTDYARVIEHYRADQVHVVGTSAMRDASGGDEFRARATEILGTAPRVISGDEEAELTFAGALSGLPLVGKVVVFDVGGGSTEVISGDKTATARRIADKASLNIGSVRLFERLLASDPPSKKELDAVRAVVQAELASLVPPSGPHSLVGVAGTVTTLAAIDQALDPYDGARVHGQALSRARVDELAERLQSLTNASRKEVAGLSTKRADVIVAGALIVQEVMGWAQATELIASDRGVRWGLAEAALTTSR